MIKAKQFKIFVENKNTTYFLIISNWFVVGKKNLTILHRYSNLYMLNCFD